MLSLLLPSCAIATWAEGTTTSEETTTKTSVKLSGGDGSTTYYLVAGLNAPAISTTDAYSIWQLEAVSDAENTYYIYSPYAQKYINNATSSGYGYADNTDDAGKFKKTEQSGYVTFQNTAGGETSFICWEKDYMTITNWSDGGSSTSSSAWTCAETDTLTDAGVTTYATAALASAKTTAQTNYDTYYIPKNTDGSNDTGKPGYHFTSVTKAEMATLISEATTLLSNSSSSTADMLAKARTLAAQSVAINDVSGKVFKIVKVKKGSGNLMYTDMYKSTEDNGWNDRKVYAIGASSLTTSYPALWSFEVSSEKYYVEHLQSGLYLGQVSSQGSNVELPTSKDWAGTYLLKPFEAVQETAGDDDAQYNACRLTYDSQAFISCAEGTDKTALSAWGEGNSNAGWKFEEVTTLPVTISSALYATYCSPVNVKISNADSEKLGAYVATVSQSNSSELVLKKITDGIIPAGVGVILHATEENTYNLEITTEAGSVTASDCALTGTTTADHTLTANSFYGLAQKNSEVGFYLSTLTEIPANKAYLKSSNSDGATALAFTFADEPTTGISGIEPTSPSAVAPVYYDLNGCRALYPAHGIFINSKGQKVLLK